MCLRRCIAGGLCAAVLAVPFVALAEQPGQVHSLDAASAQTTKPAAPSAAATPGEAQAPAASGLGPAIGAGQLAGARGGTDIGSQAQLQGTVGSNSATQVVTGNNVIQSGSFANMSGLPVVIQNSGANVLIQNATVINLELK